MESSDRSINSKKRTTVQKTGKLIFAALPVCFAAFPIPSLRRSQNSRFGFLVSVRREFGGNKLRALSNPALSASAVGEKRAFSLYFPANSEWACGDGFAGNCQHSQLISLGFILRMPTCWVAWTSV